MSTASADGRIRYLFAGGSHRPLMLGRPAERPQQRQPRDQRVEPVG
jgi:hypothetical protein